VGYGTDGGNTSGEEGQTAVEKPTVIDGALNVSIFKKTEVSKL
jgi:hypothetical protein